MNKFNPDAENRRLRAQFVRRAIAAKSNLLAYSLHRYAMDEGMNWDQLARSLNVDTDALNQVALCPPPRNDRFMADVEEIAANYVDADLLLPLLRRLQVHEALRNTTPTEELGWQPAHTLLAARDKETEEESGDSSDKIDEATTEVTGENDRV